MTELPPQIPPRIPSAQHTTRRGKPSFSCEALRSGDNLFSLIHKIGHEIGNPLTAIISLGTIIDRSLAEDQPAELDHTRLASYAMSILDESWRITLLNERCVLLLSGRTFAPMPCDVEPIVEKAVMRVRNLRSYHDIRADLTVDTTCRAVIDASQLQSLITELLMNAADAIQLSEFDDEHSASIHLSEQHGKIIIEVENPCDVNLPDDLNTLFEPLVCGEQPKKHIGVGLTVAWAIVERAGGTIEVEETPGLSFCARVILPAEEPNSVKHEPDAPLRPVGSWKERVTALGPKTRMLVIEDEATVSSAVEKILRLAVGNHTDFECTISDGSNALELLSKSADYDVVLCDINLPDISGRHVFEHVKTTCPHIIDRFAFITGERLRREVQTYLASSGRPFLLKPFEPEQIINLVLDVALDGKA